MALTQLESYMVNTSGSYTVSTLSATAGITAAGTSVIPVKIASVQSATSGYVSDSATAVSTSGGYLIITGSGFQSGCQVLIGSTYAAATTFVNSTTLNVQVNATGSGTYPVYVVNTDGSVGIKVPGIVFDAYPVWSTGATLPQQIVNGSISISLSATDSNSLTYSVTQGSTLPSGLSLSSGGLLSGTITGITSQTTYTFSIDAVDSTYNEKTARTFSVTVVVGDPYFNLTTLLLNGEGTAATTGATNNTFLDTSLNGFTVTRNGTPTQGTFTPYSQNGWSNYFNGTTDYLTVASNAVFAFGTGDFTIEFWVYPTATTAQYWFDLNDATNRLLIFYAGVNIIYYFNPGGSTLISGSAPTFNAWNHIALSRVGGSTKMFLNGVQTGSTYADTKSYPAMPLYIGKDGAAATYITGYMSNVRVLKGTGLYSSNFTPNIVPLTAITNTSLLTCQSNRFIDNSTNNLSITVNGTASVQAFAPFNYTIPYSTTTVSGSIYYNGSTDYLTVASNAALNMGTGDFTIECWVYPISNAVNYPTFLANITGWSAGASGHRFSNTNYANKFWFGLNGSAGISGGDPFMASTNTFSFNAWHHYALTRSGNTWRMFVNGNLENTQTYSGSFDAGYGGLRTGWSTWDAANGYFAGYTSNLRLIKGTAIYTSTFTPPTSPLTAISNTQLLLTGTNGGIIDQSGRSNLTTVGSATVSTSTYKYGTGSMSFNGSTSGLLAPTSPLFAFGSGDFTIELWYYPTSTSGTNPNIMCNNSGSGSFVSGQWSLHAPHATYANKYSLWVASNSTSSALLVSATSISTNTWTHIAITKSGSNWKLFLNGTSDATATYAGGLDSGTSNPQYIGYQPSVDSGRYITGYIDDLRFTKGYARYTANFTAPTTQLIGQ